METHHIALYDLHKQGENLVDQHGTPFGGRQYSRFKYGFTPPAREYAHELADLVAPHLLNTWGDAPILIMSAPYVAVPTASDAIVQYLCNELREQGCVPVRAPLRKRRSGDSSYARSSTQAERRALLDDIGLYVDGLFGRVLPQYPVLAVDDIRVTGTAEEVTDTFLRQFSPPAVWYLHVARIDEATATDGAHIEDELNQRFPHSLMGILRDYLEGSFRLNTRVLRFILEMQGTSQLQTFMGLAPINLLADIVRGAAMTGQEYMDRYQSAVMAMAERVHASSLYRGIEEMYV